MKFGSGCQPWLTRQEDVVFLARAKLLASSKVTHDQIGELVKPDSAEKPKRALLAYASRPDM